MDEDFLAQLRRVNNDRSVAWLQDSKSDPLFWATELGGECGEVLNEVKKLVREELGWKGSRTTIDKLGDEIGDVLICLDSLARHYGINLEEVVTRKFNATSDKVGFPHKLNSDDYTEYYIYTGSRCSDCGGQQFSTPSGTTCNNGHDGAEPLDNV